MATNPSQGNLPLIRIENTGAAQTNVPFTFGQVFKVGALKPGAGLAAQIEGGTIPLQADYKARHGDGSVRHAVVSGILPKLVAGATVALQLVEAKASASKALSPAVVPDGAVEITIDGVKYSTNGSNFGDVTEWLSGPVVAEGFVSAGLLGPDGKAHPHLTVRVGIRAYSSGQMRVELIVENTKTWISATNLKYDVTAKVGGKTVFEQKALTHYRHSRWHKILWLNSEPQIHIKPDAKYLIESCAVPNYDLSIVIAESHLDGIGKSISDENNGPMKIGPVSTYMPGTGGRPDIGSMPSWAVQFLLSGDKRAYASMISAADGSGSWSIHLRDETTGYPVRTDNEKNARLSTHWNLREQGPMPVPRTIGDAETPYVEDTAHQPALVYLPYLVTGEMYCLEELHFWAATNPLGTDPNNHGLGKGLVRWQQIRGQAWSLRTLGHAAYITPDKHPLKQYFIAQLDNNLEYYNKSYVKNSPNKLGVYDGSGENAFYAAHSTPWMDDFLTWSFGHLVELGFEKAKPMRDWKSKYPVGRMVGPGYCWIHGAAYGLKYRDSDDKPIYGTFSQLYLANFGKGIPIENGGEMVHPQGLSYVDQPCCSQAQADFLSLAHGSYKWPLGRMMGYADSAIGYPANMQPAIAIAADAGIDNAAKAWATFDSRSSKPDYGSAPQWAIVPRGKVEAPVVEVPPVVVPPVIAPPVVNPAPSKGLTIMTPANKQLAKMKALTVQVDDLNAMKLEQTFYGVNATSDGSVLINGATFTKSKKYQVTIRSENNMLVGVFYPMSAT